MKLNTDVGYDHCCIEHLEEELATVICQGHHDIKLRTAKGDGAMHSPSGDALEEGAEGGWV